MEVVDLKDEQCSWFPIGLASEVLRTGQLVIWSESDGGVQNAGQANAAYDTDGNVVLAGIVVGDNELTKTTDATYSGNQVTGLADDATQATNVARTWFGQEGMWSKGDTQPLVYVCMLDPTTRIKVPLYATSWGTAPALLTVTTGTTDGETMTTNASDVAPNANENTTYCRTGANAGLYRVGDDTSATVATWDKRYPYDIAVGDTFVRVQAVPGLAKVQTDAEAMYFEMDESLDTNYWGFIVEHMDLREAGKEHVVGRFIPRHFGGVD